jgi:hypothetical protein
MRKVAKRIKKKLTRSTYRLIKLNSGSCSDKIFSGSCFGFIEGEVDSSLSNKLGSLSPV